MEKGGKLFLDIKLGFILVKFMLNNLGNNQNQIVFPLTFLYYAVRHIFYFFVFLSVVRRMTGGLQKRRRVMRS
jgi:hypothetical protein